MYENDIEDIFSEKKIYCTNNLINDFYKYSKENFEPFNLNNKSLKEIELNFPLSSINTFTTLFNYEKSIKSSYIEIKNIINNKEKIRIRKNIKDFTTYNNKFNILNSLKNETWEYKKIEDLTEINNFIFKTSRETISTSNFFQSKKIKFYYINSIQLYNEYFKSEIRLRTELQQNEENNNILLNYFNPKNTARKLDLEIELNSKLEKIEEEKFKKYFLNILQYTFGVSKSNFYFNFSNTKKNLRTSMINLYDLLDFDIKDYIFMDKIDGEYIHFHVKDGICYITKNNIILELKCNIFSYIEFSGDGELIYYKQKRFIFPFYINEIKKKNNVKTFTTRKDYLKYINKYIIKDYLSENISFQLEKNQELSLFFKIKEIFGPYETKEEFLENFLKSYEQTSNIPKDGLIISKNNVLDPSCIEDYKFKKHNTIDIFTNLNINFKKNNNLNFSLLFISLKEKEKNNKIIKEKKINNLYNIDITEGNNYYYDYNLSMIIIYIEAEKRFSVYPVTFIAEYNIEQKFFKPRLDKTNKLYQTGAYFGNGFEVIIKSLVIHNYKLYFTKDLLLKINKNEETLNSFLKDLKEKIDDYTLIEKKKIIKQSRIDIDSEENYNNTHEEEEKNYIFEPLNGNIAWYKESNNNTRTILNNISNLNKSFGIFFGCGNMVNKENYKNVISIYCGKGGDMGKFINNDFNYVVGIDPDKNALDIFKERRKFYVENKAKIFKLITVNLRLEEKNFLDILYKHISINETFDVIDIQLGIHFSLCKESETHIMDIFTHLANKNKSPKTKILISTNDKDNILKIYNKKNIKEGEILKLNIDNNSYIEISTNKEKLNVYYPLSMNKPSEEFLMSKNYLIPLFNKYDFKLIETWCFNEILEEKNIYENIMSVFSNRKSTLKFIEIIKQIDLNLYDLRDIASTYRYYIFEYNKTF